MENGKIKDNQVTASSSRPADLPHYGRLNNGKYWCAGKADKNQYFQVDLGQVRKWKPVSCLLRKHFELIQIFTAVATMDVT